MEGHIGRQYFFRREDPDRKKIAWEVIEDTENRGLLTKVSASQSIWVRGAWHGRYRRPASPLLRGFAFEGSDFDSKVVYLWVFVKPG